jgi:hypothetical protein
MWDNNQTAEETMQVEQACDELVESLLDLLCTKSRVEGLNSEC